MNICGACKYEGEDFIEVVVGKQLEDYHGEEEYDFGIQNERFKNSKAWIKACPNCGTLKLSHIDLEED